MQVCSLNSWHKTSNYLVITSLNKYSSTLVEGTWSSLVPRSPTHMFAAVDFLGVCDQHTVWVGLCEDGWTPGVQVCSLDSWHKTLIIW